MAVSAVRHRAPTRFIAPLLVAVLAAPALAASDPLDTPVRASWTGVPLRDWADRAAGIAGRPVVVDRRIDPTVPVTLACHGEPLRAVLDRVAAIAGAEVEVLAATIRLVPKTAAGLAGSAEASREADMPRLPAALRRTLQARAAWEWPAAARPRDLVATAASAAGITVAGLETIPHDHFAAASLPPLSLADRLDLVLAHFDRRIAWSGTAGTVVASEREAAPAKPRTAGSETPPSPRPRPGKPDRGGGRETFSLRVEAPFDQAVAAIASRLGLEPSIDEASLAARGIAPGEIVRVDVRDASRDGLLDSLVQPLGLSWTIDDGRLRVSAPAADGGPSTRSEAAP